MALRDRRILTEPQAATLEALRRHIDRHGESPTLDELAQTLGIKLPTVADRIRGLTKKGYVARTSRQWRNLKPVESHTERIVQVPLAFSVGADNLSVFAEREFGNYMQVQESLLDGHRNVFAVRVMGDSMRDAGIANGSFVLAEEADLAGVRNGERVIAIIGDMIVLKRIIRTASAVILEPQNNSGEYSSIVVDNNRDDFRIIGRCIDILPIEDPDRDDVQFVPEI